MAGALLVLAHLIRRRRAAFAGALRGIFGEGVVFAVSPAREAAGRDEWLQLKVPARSWVRVGEFSIASIRLPRLASIAGWCRPRRFASICASAWPTGSACSGCR